MSQESMVSCVVVPYGTQVGRDFAIGVCTSSFSHIQRRTDVTIIGDTAVFGYLQVVVDEAEMHIVFVTQIVGK